MQLSILDGNNVTQTILAKGLEAIRNTSGTIVATGVSQTLIPANPLRSGWFLQNCSQNDMVVNDVGEATIEAGGFIISPGGIFPPSTFPVTPNVIKITGTQGDAFSVREF